MVNTFLPIWQVKTERLAQLVSVQHRIARTLSRGGVVRRSDGPYGVLAYTTRLAR